VEHGIITILDYSCSVTELSDVDKLI